MKKVLLLIIPFLLVSCTYDGFDKVTSDFIENFNIKDAYSSTNTVTLNRVSRIYNYKDNSEKDISNSYTTIIFDKSDANNLYYFEEVKEYKGEKNSLKSVEIKKEDDKYFRYLIEDDQSSKSEISKDTITTYFKKFFYTSDAGNMYLDGYYYGDSIKINRKYYELFTLDEENEILNYKLFNDNTHPDYVVNTTFSVNKFGMLLNLETSTKELEGSLCSFSEVTSIYN